MKCDQGRDQAKYVVIGNSAAAVGAVESIRARDALGEIALISKESYHVYSRPLISYYLGGRIGAQDVYYRPRDFYRRHSVRPMLGSAALSVDFGAKSVLLADGTSVGYEKLLVATGGVPFIPKIEGLDKEPVLTFTMFDDAKKLSRLVGERIGNVVVVGGGLIGLKATEALAERGVKVTVVELADRILSLALDERASRLAEKRLAAHGVNVVTGTTIAEVTGANGRVDGVVLQDGRAIPCRAVVIAIGVVPNVEPVKAGNAAAGNAATRNAATGNGALTPEIGRGILVDDHMRTTTSDVYAAGDVAEGPEMLGSGRRVIPIWPNAYTQGAVAGANMAGADVRHPGGLPMNSVEFFGLPTISVGITDPNTGPTGQEFEVLTRYDAGRPNYRKLVLKDGVLVGAIFVGGIDRAGIVTGLIRDKCDARHIAPKLLEDGFGFISFPEPLRAEKLGAAGRPRS